MKAKTAHFEPLYTQYFNTPVTMVELRRDKKQTVLVITLRADVQPSVSSEVASSGFNFVYFDFPAGQYVDSAQPVAATPAPPVQPDGSVLSEAPPDPSHLEGEIDASGQVRGRANASTAMDHELPPGMGKTKAKTSAGFSVGR